MKNFLQSFKENVTPGTIFAIIYGLIWYFFVSGRNYTESFYQSAIFFVGFMGSSLVITYSQNHPDKEKGKRIRKRYIIITLIIFAILIGLLIITTYYGKR